MALESDRDERALARPALTVSALNRAVAGVLTRSFPLVRVVGEIANFSRAGSGHWYFALKDGTAQVRCVMFRGRNVLVEWAPRDGDQVEVTAVVALYEARGEYQLTIESMQRAGQGRLFEEFVRLKQRLAAEGLFDRGRKRALPLMPTAVGVVTSLQAAALQDVLTTLARRAPYLTVVVYPAPVQGAGAAGAIAAVLANASARAEVEVLLLVRGGGSIEDLWSFNDERVARAIVGSAMPVVVGVGHDTDVTIADFAADVRAPTPTAAAEMVAPPAADLVARAGDSWQRLQRCFAHRLDSAAQRLDYAQRALATPRAPLAALDQRVGALQARIVSLAARRLAASSQALHQRRTALLSLRPAAARSPAHAIGICGRALWQRWHAHSARLAQLAGRLDALDPMAVLTRGYSITLDRHGAAVADARQLAAGDEVRLVFARGAAVANVASVQGGAAGDDRIDFPPRSPAEES